VAVGCELDFLARAVKQPLTERFFQRFDAAAKRRLGHEQLARSFDEGAGLGQADEVADLRECHLIPCILDHDEHVQNALDIMIADF